MHRMHMVNDLVRSRKMASEDESGFTLIELLVVIAIVATLAGFGITMMMSARHDADELATKSFIQTLGATLEQYRNDRKIGVFPPSTLDGSAGLGKQKNRTNQGIESLVVALNSPKFTSADRALENFESEDGEIRATDNLDGDSSAKPMTIHGTRELFEITDPWGNPFDISIRTITRRRASASTPRSPTNRGITRS